MCQSVRSYLNRVQISEFGTQEPTEVKIKGTSVDRRGNRNWVPSYKKERAGW